MTKITLLRCLHCKHEWASRLGKRPKVCPNCKSYNWDKAPITKHRVKGEKVV